MEKYCIFCREELSLLNSKTLYCCNTQQPVCRKCYKELIPLSAEERGRRALNSGRALERETIQAYLAEQETYAQERKTAEEQARKARISDKLCPHCGVPFLKLGRKCFQMGEENFFVDTHFWEGSLELDIFYCPQCRKVEFFLPEDFDPGGFD